MAPAQVVSVLLAILVLCWAAFSTGYNESGQRQMTHQQSSPAEAIHNKQVQWRNSSVQGSSRAVNVRQTGSLQVDRAPVYTWQTGKIEESSSSGGVPGSAGDLGKQRKVLMREERTGSEDIVRWTVKQQLMPAVTLWSLTRLRTSPGTGPFHTSRLVVGRHVSRDRILVALAKQRQVTEKAEVHRSSTSSFPHIFPPSPPPPYLSQPSLSPSSPSLPNPPTSPPVPPPMDPTGPSPPSPLSSPFTPLPPSSEPPLPLPPPNSPSHSSPPPPPLPPLRSPPPELPAAESLSPTYPPSLLGPIPRGAVGKPLKACPTEGIEVSSSNFRKPWEGWGTSLAWFANYIGGLPQFRRENLLDLIFDKVKGLGLNIVRYNIGGGYNPKFSPQFIVNTHQRFRGMPGFKATADSPYNWSADARQMKVLFGARARGANKAMAFSNGPPWWMTVSGDVAGRSNPRLCNLRSNMFDDFASFLTDVVKHFKEEYDLEFTYLEPVNEAQEGFWRKGLQHEGCYFSPSQLNLLFDLCGKSLAAKGLLTELAGIDSSLGITPGVFQRMGETGSHVNLMKQFHVHGYVRNPRALNDPQIRKAHAVMGNMGQRYNRDIWLSEWGPRPMCGTTSNDLSLALCMAKSINCAINILNATAWVYWQVIDATPVWALINVPWDDGVKFSINLTKRYYFLKMFSGSARAGSQPVAIPTTAQCQQFTSSFYDPQSFTLHMFVVNTEGEDRSLVVSLKGFKRRSGSRFVKIERCVTSASTDMGCKNMGELSSWENLKILCEARSFTRFTLRHIAVV